MSRFAAVPKAYRAETPNYVQAQMVDNKAYEDQYDRKMELARDGVSAFDKWKGDRTLAEALRFGAKAPQNPTGLGPVMGGQTTSAPAQMTAAGMAADATPDMVGQLATQAPAEMSNYVMAPAVDAATNVAADAGGSVISNAAPVISALRGGQQLVDGDVEGALGTGAKAGLAMLGPYGWAGAGALSLLGV